MKHLLIPILCCWIATPRAFSQFHSGNYQKTLWVTNDTTIIDSAMLVYGSCKALGYSDSLYHIDYNSSRLIWHGKKPQDSIVLNYQILHFNFRNTYKNKNPDIIQQFFSENPFSYVPPSERFNSLRGEQINTSGNIARGIGFGNNQDLVVNSNLNLRMSGKIGGDVNVLAAVSDENNPIQPEGNTQQLQDFDRVYISLWKDSTSLTAGDFPMQSNSDWYFMKYQKRARGLQATHLIQLGDNQLLLSGEAAVSRGRFTRNLINAIEGNQGPYRLQGTNGELFIIVIAGTEKIYLDGELLERGAQNDYVIDYNAGEITFTPKRLITQYTRIVAEFQFSDRNYGRSVVRTGADFVSKRWKLSTQYFTEQDHKNQNFQQSLDGYDSTQNKSAREILRDAGESGNAFISGSRKVESFDADRIMYVERDTLGFEKVYVYVNNAQEGGVFYNVVFSYVGPNNGNYQQQNSTANGKVYEWLEPVGGNRQGDYEPVEILIAPVRNQMLVVGLEHQANENWQIKTEWSISQNDLNTFSDLGESDNIGNGILLHLAQDQKLGGDSSMWKMRSNFKYERASKNFRFIERYRGVEFNRMWNRTLYNEGENPEKLGDEHVAQADINLQNGRKMRVDLVGAYFQRSNVLDAWQHQLKWNYQPGLWTMQTSIEQLRGDQPFEDKVSSNKFDHYNVYLGRRIRSQQLGFNFKQERSLFNDAQNDSLTSSSYSFNQYTAFIARDSGTISYRIELNQREDAQVNSGELKPFTLGRDAKFNAAWQAKKNVQLSLLSSYRRLSFDDSLARLKDEETMQGRFELRWSFFNNSVRTQTYYQIGSGQEQKREFSYIPVGDGNGIYVWNDYDGNGVQTLDEFEIASDFDRPRANFIRQFLPVSGLVKTYSTEFNNNIRIQANRRSEKKIAFMVFLNRFSILSNTRIQKKLGSNAADQFLNPFYLEIADSALISSNNTYRNTLSFNRSHPIFGADYQQLRNNGKTLLLNGFDSRSNLEHRFKIRWNIDKKWEVIAINSFGNQSYESDFLSSRSYLYDFVEWTPSIQYYLNKNFRLGGEYKYFEAHNDPKFGKGASYNHELSANFQLNYLNKGNVRFNLALIEVNFKGSESSALGYALLEGLKNGRNIAWNVNIDQRFSNNVQGLISYDGRVSETGPIIHIGRVQLRYLF